MKKLHIVKIGGNVIDDPEQLRAFLADFAAVEGDKILVHGGGKIATKIGDRLGIVSSYHNGRRITDADTIDVVTMVYGGLINKNLVARLNSLGCNAIGLTGADANTIPAVKRPVKTIDYGFVGDIIEGELNTTFILSLLDQHTVPVFAPLTADDTGQMLNTNADTIASSLATALSPHREVSLVYCFEQKGVLSDIHNPDSVISPINKHSFQSLLEEKKIFDGMIPKIENALAALEKGVSSIVIGYSGDLLRNTGDNPSGTLINP